MRSRDLQVKEGDVVQVSLIIVSFNASTHLGRYTLTASNVAGTATASISVRLTSAFSSPSTVGHHWHGYRTPTDDMDDLTAAAAVLQRPDNQYQQLSGERKNFICQVATNNNF